MNQIAEKPATYADLCAVPAHQVAQIINGELIVQPRPAPKHVLAASGMGGKLMNPFHYGDGGPGGWWILIEPELHLGKEVIVPDIAGWRRERMPKLPETAYFSLAPDWVCEVLSPSTAQIDRVAKMPIYLAAGVTTLWLVEPNTQVLETYVAHQQQWLLHKTYKNADAVAAPPFEAISFELAALWEPE